MVRVSVRTRFTVVVKLTVMVMVMDNVWVGLG